MKLTTFMKHYEGNIRLFDEKLDKDPFYIATIYCAKGEYLGTGYDTFERIDNEASFGNYVNPNSTIDYIEPYRDPAMGNIGVNVYIK